MASINIRINIRIKNYTVAFEKSRMHHTKTLITSQYCTVLRGSFIFYHRNIFHYE